MNLEENFEKTIIIKTETNSSAITSLVLGIIGVVVGFIPYVGWFMAPVWILAIIFGLIGMRKKHRRGMSIFGAVLGLLGALYKVGFWIVALGGVASILSYEAETINSYESPKTNYVMEENETKETELVEPELISIPSVNSVDLETAKTILEESGFTVKITKVDDESVPKGVVVKTEPESGSNLQIGSEVTVFESDGKPAEELVVRDMFTGKESEIIQGRKAQIFLTLYFPYYTEIAGEVTAMDIISNNIDKLNEASVEVIGIIEDTTSYDEKQLISNKDWRFPVYMGQYYFNLSNTNPYLILTDGTGELIEMANIYLGAGQIKEDVLINEILDKVKTH